VRVAANQCDQIRRIFANWADVYIGHFFNK
jgi:hypothetical protein